MRQPTISIVTPVYNREELLKRTYDSLIKQTDYDFEWIIVDDGSSDNSFEVASSFSQHYFPIKCIRKSNGGKHTALNVAASLVSGKYVLILDSDDFLVENAVQTVKFHWKVYDDYKNVGFLIFLRLSEAKNNNTKFCFVSNYNKPVCFFREKRIKVYSKDCCEVLKTTLFKQYKFPEYKGERFIGESALWDRLGTTYDCVYIDEGIYVCEYMEDGLTKSGRALRIKNPKGGMYVSRLRMNKRNLFSQRMKYSAMYSCYGLFAKIKPSKIISTSGYPFMTTIMFPIGSALYIYWRKLLKNKKF